MAAFSTSQQIAGLAVWLLVSFAAAAIGGIASADAGAFYQQLARPDWAPPAWLFAPVWSILYLMMAIAAWLIWREGGFRPARLALSLFLLQLAANALWTWLFFVWHQGALALTEILLLWILLFCTGISFRRIRPLATLLLLPYFGWVTFASLLTYALWRMNPTLLG